MKRAYYRIGFTTGQSEELWERWKKGEGLKAIGWIKVVHGLIGLAVLSTLVLLALMHRIAFLLAWATFVAVIVVGLLGVYRFSAFWAPMSVNAVVLSLFIALLAAHWRQIGVLKPM